MWWWVRNAKLVAYPSFSVGKYIWECHKELYIGYWHLASQPGHVAAMYEYVKKVLSGSHYHITGFRVFTIKTLHFTSKVQVQKFY